MYTLPITLTIAGAAALVNFWLALRISRTRAASKTWMGDGGDPALIARMRAQANFIEYTPIILILIGAIELARGTTSGLWIVGAVYILGRLAHGLGMDGGRLVRLRSVGAVSTLLILIGLGLYAIAIPYLGFSPVVTNVASIG